MSELMQRQSLLMKETDSDTYMLFSLHKNESEQFVLNEGDKDTNALVDKLIEKLSQEPAILKLNTDKLNIPEVTSIDDIFTGFQTKLYQVDFQAVLTEQLSTCFPEMDTEAIFDKTELTHYGLFSYKSCLHYLQYLIIGLNSSASEDEMLYPYSFMSIEKEKAGEIVKTKQNPNAAWEPTDSYFIYNVCKSHKINKKGICTHMLNIFSNSEYAEKPLFLFVDSENKAAMNCYTKNQFQKVEDVFSGRVGRPVGVKMQGEKDIYMCRNKQAMKLSFINGDDTVEYELMPIGSYRISLIAHGAVDLDPTKVFEPEFDINQHYKQYLFPFKNMQYYAKLGAGVSLMSQVDETSAIYDVCYDTVVSNYKDEPSDQTVSTIPMIFHGFKKDDPESRKNFIGLYDCNMKRRIKENVELFGNDNEKVVHLDKLMQIIYVYCNENEISFENVEIKIFACRGFCPVGEFAPVAMEGGDGDGDKDSVEHYESMNKSTFFEYLKKEMSTCPLQKKGGRKNKKKATRQHKKKATRQHKKKSLKNKTRKYKKYT
jgi:hypothetical protein